MFTSPHNPAVMFAAIRQRGLLRSSDQGRSWNPVVGLPIEPTVIALVVHADVAYAADVEHTVYRSEDGGRTFARVGKAGPADGRPPRWITIAATQAAVFLGTTRGAYVSRDRGATWVPLALGRLGMRYHTNDIFPIDDTTVIIATSVGVFAGPFQRP